MARVGQATDPRLWVFQRWLAATFVVAWLSLGSQVLVLCGSRGLAPFAEVLAHVPSSNDLGWFDAPTLFLWGVSDSALKLGCILGASTSTLALFGVFPRLLLGVNLMLYLSYAVACVPFLSFQWDNLLLECAFLAVVAGLSQGAWRVFLFRVLLFKLYFESGIAKYQSHLGDWLDGSAMTFYYETAPLPTPLAWYAHALPEAWHHLESWGTLAFEIVGALFVFSPRPTRLALALVLTGFQLVNFATANYGFFTTLSLGLHLFLLEAGDLRLALAAVLVRLRRWSSTRGAVRHLRRLRRAATAVLPATSWTPRIPVPTRVGLALAAFVTTVYVGVSLASGARRFVSRELEVPLFAALDDAIAPFRVINTYHLFAHITRERIEPEFQTLVGETWTPHWLHYKPGPPERNPPFVAPHQPRVDFQLWFFGLGHERRPPLYVVKLLRRLCDDPDAVGELFSESLPERPSAARIVFYRYQFTSPEERAATGAMWTREPVGRPRMLGCQSDQGSK